MTEIEMVVAYICPDKLSDVKQALVEVGAPSLTVTNVSGRGSQPVKTGQWRGEEYTIDLHEKVKIECVVTDISTEDVVNAIVDDTLENQVTERCSLCQSKKPTRFGLV